MKNKSNYDLDSTYKRLEEHTKKINFLRDAVRRLKTESFISAETETDFLENGYGELIEQIKLASKETILNLLTTKIDEEEKVLNNIMRVIQNGKD